MKAICPYGFHKLVCPFYLKKPRSLKAFMNELPFESIICFLHIQFNEKSNIVLYIFERKIKVT